MLNEIIKNKAKTNQKDQIIDKDGIRKKQIR